jgi:hypothetical protein
MDAAPVHVIEDKRRDLSEDDVHPVSSSNSDTQPDSASNITCDAHCQGSVSARESVRSYNVAQESDHARQDVLPLHILRSMTADWRKELVLEGSNHDGSSDRLGWPGQCLFVCLEQGPMDHYAIKIPCFWPQEYRRTQRKMVSMKEQRIIEEEHWSVQPWEVARECNSDVLERILYGCYRYIGSWKRFIPFFGITDLKFVQVSD